MKILSNVLVRQYEFYKEELDRKALEVLSSGWYVLGKEVTAFEEEFAAFLTAKRCVGLASGLDALKVALRVLDIKDGDEVIVPSNTYIATVLGVTANGAVPVFCEPDEFYNIDVSQIEEKITSKTKAVLSVNLYGQACDMKALRALCDKHGLFLVEDCAQSHGAKFDGLFTNKYADISCFSFYPTKNLGCFGDGGAIVTDSDEWANFAKILRNYGSEKRYYNMVEGTNSRLDELQAGLLRVKLSHIGEIEARRFELVRRYAERLNNPLLALPTTREGATSVWHQYVVRCAERDKLQDYLKENDIQTVIHYPVPPHLSGAYEYLGLKVGSLPVAERYANEILSLPLYDGMTREEQDYVIDVLNGFGGTI